MSINAWRCKRTGKCCKLFVSTGVVVTNEEWELIEKDIRGLEVSKDEFEKCRETKTLPVIGKNPPKKCAFLKTNKCLIYKKRPQRCKEYPIMIQEYDDCILLHISSDCPRTDDLLKIIKKKKPMWPKKKLGRKKRKIIVNSFYDKKISQYYGEEE